MKTEPKKHQKQKTQSRINLAAGFQVLFCGTMTIFPTTEHRLTPNSWNCVLALGTFTSNYSVKIDTVLHATGWTTSLTGWESTPPIYIWKHHYRVPRPYSTVQCKNLTCAIVFTIEQTCMVCWCECRYSRISGLDSSSQRAHNMTTKNSRFCTTSYSQTLQSRSAKNSGIN